MRVSKTERFRLLVACGVLLNCATAPSRGAPPDAALIAQLRLHHVPGLSVAVIHDARVVWAKAWGVKNVETAAPLDPDTPLQAASVSKLVTALGALQAVEAGTLSLDADVNEALRRWQLPHTSPVSLRQLLSHTAGVNLHSVPGYLHDAKLPNLLQILDGVAPATNPPIRVEGVSGEYAYSGGGLTIVQQMLEDTAHLPFAQILHRQLFAPLHLTHTTFELPAAAHLGDAARCADAEGRPLPFMVNPESAAAGLWSTPKDLARLLIELQRGLRGQSTLFSAQLAKRVVTPVAPIVKAKDNDGVAVSMGLGAFLEQRHGTVYFGHDGLNDGFLTVIRANERGDGIVVMANGAGAAPVMLELIRGVAREYQWPGWE